MLRSYVTLALRNLQRHRGFTAINVTCLALGFACCLLILLFIRHELSYDRHVPDAEQVYQVRYHTTTGNDLAAVPPPMAPRLTEFFSEVETAARAFFGNVSVRVPEQTPGEGDRTFEEDQTFFVDSTFTHIFPLEFVAGDPAQDLRQPFTAILSEETAERFFGDQNPIGQTITIEGNYTFTVTGVAKDFPTTSHLHFGLLLPYDDMFKIQGPQAEAVMRQNLGMNWVISHSITYVKLKSGASPENVSSRFEAMVAEYAPPQLQVGQRFSLTPLLDIHLGFSFSAGLLRMAAMARAIVLRVAWNA